MSSHVAGIIQQPSTVLQNKGTTSTGKTLKSSVAVSQSGDPLKIVKSADITKTAAERDSIATDGMCSIFDEVGLLKNPEGLTYLLSNGRKKQRGTKDGLEASEEWYKSFILNGEFEFLKESAAQGEIGRLIECSWKLPTDEINVKKTEAAIRENFGHITPLFIKKMFKDINLIKPRYAEICKALPSSSIDIGSRLKDSFALIILAGEILEDVYQEIGIEKKDPMEICKSRLSADVCEIYLFFSLQISK
jgi:putative DNA primase/helicase